MGKRTGGGQSGWRAKVVENSKRNDDIERAFGGEAERGKERERGRKEEREGTRNKGKSCRE